MAKTRFGYVGSGQIPGAIFGTRNQVPFGWRMRSGREAPRVVKVAERHTSTLELGSPPVTRNHWFHRFVVPRGRRVAVCQDDPLSGEMRANGKTGQKGPIARIVRSAYNYEVGVVPSRLPFSSIALLWTNKVNFRRRGFTHPQSSIMVRWMVRRERTLGETLASFTWRSSFSA